MFGAVQPVHMLIFLNIVLLVRRRQHLRPCRVYNFMLALPESNRVSLHLRVRSIRQHLPQFQLVHSHP